MKRNYFGKIVAVVMAVTVFAGGCGKAEAAAVMEQAALQTEVESITVPDNIKVVGLGEASHGAKEYQQMKLEVFQALVENNGCRTFIIEGDFGGALKVDEYIQGGQGTAKEVVSEIGFKIYNTQEMADLIEWMRGYNQTVVDGELLHFYGMDLQRYDNNKEYLFAVLDEAAPELGAKYKEAFASLTDEDRFSLGSADFKQAKKDAQQLMSDMDAAKENIAGVVGEETFELARECANTIYMCSDVMGSSDLDYNKLRDGYMFDKINWFMEHEEGVLFINGHNGHIGKESVSGYTCLGELLAESLGEDYFSIGTDAKCTEFNSQGNDGGFSVMEVTNQNELNMQCETIADGFYYIDFSKVTDEETKNIISGKQRITTLNVGIAQWQKFLKMFYTTSVVPEENFDGMIVFDKVVPTTLF